MPEIENICPETSKNPELSKNDMSNGLGTQQACQMKCEDSRTLIEYYTEVADKLPQRQAFYVMDFADILFKIRQWKKRLPRVDIFYAVKAHADPVLLKFLTHLGLSFDCATQLEIEMALASGAPPENIIFAHTIKTEDELQFASDAGVDLMTFDNEEELLKIHKYHKKSKLLIRLSPPNMVCQYDLSEKFGCKEEEAPELLSVAKALGLNVIGISFHVGGLCTEPSSYASAIQLSHRIFKEAKKIGFNLTILDIGGGFYGNTGTENIFEKMAASINEALDTYFPGNDVRVIGEPGCYIVASAVKLVSTIIGKKSLKNAEKDKISMHYFINNSIYGSFFRTIELYGIIPKPLLPNSEVLSRPILGSKIFGQTCCSEDVIKHSMALPEMKIGEKIIWENMGAYSRGLYSTFCGAHLPLIKYIFVENELRNDWMENNEKVQHFINEHCAYICDTEP